MLGKKHKKKHKKSEHVRDDVNTQVVVIATISVRLQIVMRFLNEM